MLKTAKSYSDAVLTNCITCAYMLRNAKLVIS